MYTIWIYNYWLITVTVEHTVYNDLSRFTVFGLHLQVSLLRPPPTPSYQLSINHITLNPNTIFMFSRCYGCVCLYVLITFPFLWWLWTYPSNLCWLHSQRLFIYIFIVHNPHGYMSSLFLEFTPTNTPLYPELNSQHW